LVLYSKHLNREKATKGFNEAGDMMDEKAKYWRKKVD